jgi:hypothetical protein
MSTLVATLRSSTAAAGALLALAAPAQVQFTESIKSHFPFDRSLARGVATADVDSDGDRDLFFAVSVFGAPLGCRLYRNDGGHAFTDVSSSGLPQILLQANHAAFGDFDGDSDPDLIVADAWQDRLWLNDGSGRFTDRTSGRLPVELLDTRRLVLGDLDGDGDLDVVRVNYGPPTVWLNDGTGVFTDVSATHAPAFAQVGAWDVTLGDTEGDGDLDVAIAAQVGHLLWLNDGTGRFSDASGARLPSPAVHAIGIRFADVDGDLDRDLVCGNWNAAPTLYLNDGAGSFVDASAARMPTLVDNVWCVDVGDADSDGDVDVAFGVVGQNRLFVNDGTGVFADATAARMPEVADGTIQLAFADLDGDSDLDLVSANTFQENRLCYNDGGVFVDAAPSRFEGVVGGPYALAIGDVDGDGDLDVVRGEGDAGGYNESCRLVLNDGLGFFGMAPGGAFPVDGDDTRAVVLGDVDGDGDRDAVLGNHGAPPRLYLNSGNGTFTDASTWLPASVASTRALGLGDVDGDLDLDLVIGDFAGQSRLFLNSGSSFIDATATRLPAAVLDTRALALVDVDGDGDRDLVLGNGQAQGQQNRLYLNDGTGTFADVTATHLPVEAAPTSSVAVGDVDGDGDPDLVFGNDSTVFGWRNSLYLNDGSGRFTNRSWQLVFEQYRTFSVALGDVDEDGDLDLVCGDHNHWNKLHLNDGTGTFSDATPHRMPAMLEDTVAVALCDADGDGDLDLISAGNGWTRAVVALYPNHHRQIDSPRLAHVGENHVVRVHSRAGHATTPSTALVVLGTARANVSLPPFGTLRVDPAGMVVLPAVALPAPTGTGDAVVPIPALPAVVGVHVYFQALVVSGGTARFTNLLDERIGGF